MASTQKMPVVPSRVRLAAAARMPDGHERVGRGSGEAQDFGDTRSIHAVSPRGGVFRLNLISELWVVTSVGPIAAED
jgi:hypothetical protein